MDNVQSQPRRRAGDALAPTRRSLLSRLKNWDDRESWNEFFTVYWKLIYRTAKQAGLTDGECEDVVQETVISVAKHMPQFKYDPELGSFKAWLFKMTRWRIRDQYKKRLPPNVVAGTIASRPPHLPQLEDVPDPAGSELDALWEAEWEKNIFDAALELVKREADPKSFQVFDLLVLQQWPMEKVREVLKVNATRVYVAKHRISKLVRKQMERLEKQMI